MTHLAHLARPRRRGAPVAFGALGALGVPLSAPGISVAVGSSGAPRALGAPGALGALGAWRASRACRTRRAFRTWRTGAHLAHDEPRRAWRAAAAPARDRAFFEGGAPRFTARLHCRSARLRRCVNWLNEQGGALLTICINQDDRAKDVIKLKGAKTKW